MTLQGERLTKSTKKGGREGKIKGKWSLLGERVGWVGSVKRNPEERVRQTSLTEEGRSEKINHCQSWRKNWVGIISLTKPVQ